MPRFHRLERVKLIPRPLPETFAFFANAQNLEALTPAFLRFRIETPLPVEMRVGARIDYQLALWGVPLRWRTSISVWEPNRCFVDEQERGPYRYWRHLHEFAAEGHGTRMRDEVTYALPFGLIGEVAHALLVKRQLATIFDFREQAILGSLGAAITEPA
jgi:ligand-binding SRPBCC domain-containing protein